MSSTKGDPDPPGAASSDSSDIKPPTLTESGTADADADPPVGGGGTGGGATSDPPPSGGGGIKDSSGIGE